MYAREKRQVRRRYVGGTQQVLKAGGNVVLPRYGRGTEKQVRNRYGKAGTLEKKGMYAEGT